MASNFRSSSLLIKLFSFVSIYCFLILKNIILPAACNIIISLRLPCSAFKQQRWLLLQNYESADLIIITAGPCRRDEGDLLMSPQPDLLTA